MGSACAFSGWNHDELKSKVSKLEKQPEVAKKPESHGKTQNCTPQAIELLKPTEDETALLKFIQVEGDVWRSRQYVWEPNTFGRGAAFRKEQDWRR